MNRLHTITKQAAASTAGDPIIVEPSPLTAEDVPFGHAPFRSRFPSAQIPSPPTMRSSNARIMTGKLRDGRRMRFCTGFSSQSPPYLVVRIEPGDLNVDLLNPQPGEVLDALAHMLTHLLQG